MKSVWGMGWAEAVWGLVWSSARSAGVTDTMCWAKPSLCLPCCIIKSMTARPNNIYHVRAWFMSITHVRGCQGSQENGCFCYCSCSNCYWRLKAAKAGDVGSRMWGELLSDKYITPVTWASPSITPASTWIWQMPIFAWWPCWFYDRRKKWGRNIPLGGCYGEIWES